MFHLLIRCSHLMILEGGKYTGFGYSMDPPPRSQSNNEGFDQAVTALSKGWNMFSLAATKIASTASENAWKFGGIAQQKATEIHGSVSEKVKHKKNCFKLVFNAHLKDVLFFYLHWLSNFNDQKAIISDCVIQ